MRKPINREVAKRWALQWRSLCASSRYNYYLFSESEWKDGADAAGLQIDMFEPIKQAFPGVDFYSVEGLKTILPQIKDPVVLGDFIVTMCYRVFKSEGYDLPPAQWFLLAFDRFLELLK